LSGSSIASDIASGIDSGGDPAAVIHVFYGAFARLDAMAMAQCYAPDASFEDPVFTLQGRHEIAGMWSMLCDAVRRDGMADWSLTHERVSAVAGLGVAHWTARYRFSATGRLVENHIDARLRFDAAGRIVEHRDSFDFWRWSRQALGIAGLALGWTPYLQGKVRAQARRRLDRHLRAALPASGAGADFRS
jgi:ketosteroid isomerase-like protein